MSGARQGILVIAPPGPGNYQASVEPIPRAAHDAGGPRPLSRPGSSFLVPGLLRDPHAYWYVTYVPLAAILPAFSLMPIRVGRAFYSACLNSIFSERKHSNDNVR